MVNTGTPPVALVTAPAPSHITTEIRAEIARGAVTGKDLATALGVAPATLSRKLAGSIPLTVPELLTICARLNVAPSTLLADAERRATA